MKIILGNGKSITGESWEEVLTNLKNSTMYFADQSLEEYMDGLRRRVWVSHGKWLRLNGAESVLRQLSSLGILKFGIDEEEHITIPESKNE